MWQIHILKYNGAIKNYQQTNTRSDNIDNVHKKVKKKKEDTVYCVKSREKIQDERMIRKNTKEFSEVMEIFLMI